MAGPEDLQAIAAYLPPDARALVVRRFDRDPSGRVHQEDLAQVLSVPPHPSQRKFDFTYEALLRVLGAVTGTDGLTEAVRRLAFVVASGNADAHLKNWSIVYPDGRTARHSPLYDQVSTVAWARLDNTLALKLVGTRDFAQIDSARLRYLGSKLGVDEGWMAGTFAESVSRLRDAWPATAALPSRHRRALVEHWARVPMLRGVGPLGP
jgi:serine/threonine-protein kinase HipA